VTARHAPSGRYAAAVGMTDRFLDDLAVLPPSATRDAYASFVREHGDDAFRRDGGPEHLTGSCFVFSPSFDEVLLTHHRKGRFWVQFGGHVEDGDDSVAATALREGREESGVADLRLRSDAIVDLDRHELHGGFSCAAHWDVGYVAVVDRAAGFAASDESLDVRWFPVDALPDDLAPGFAARLSGVLAVR
jgi:8-oxo-dGTP pyrophosphatase MutT (NUDIX family)